LDIDVEVSPDDYAVLYDDDGLLSHANVFSDVRLSGKINDKIRTMYPDSMIRAARASKMMKKYVKKAKDVEAFKNSLADHFGYPNSVCRHPDPNEPEDKRAETLASVIMDLDTKTMWISNGNPCSNEFTEVKFDAIRGN
jgi:isopenicillin-N N-acyltransferase-like protein